MKNSVNSGKMTTKNSVAALTRISQSTFRYGLRPAPSMRVSRTFSSSQRLDAAPPLLVQIKTDLKTAMRAKDAPRLSVLRSILSASNEAAKQDKEITTDEQVVGLLKKTAAGINQAREEAQKANRQDLVEKEEAQIKIVDEYVAKAEVDIMSDEEIKSTLQARLVELRASGESEQKVSNALMKETGQLAWVPKGKYVERSVAFQILQEMLKQ